MEEIIKMEKVKKNKLWYVIPTKNVKTGELYKVEAFVDKKEAFDESAKKGKFMV